MRDLLLRVLSPEAEATQVFHQHVFRHRVTGEIRAADWTVDGIVFESATTGRTFRRSHRKALAWLTEAEDLVFDEVVAAKAPAVGDQLPPEAILAHAARRAAVRAIYPPVQAEVRLPDAAASPSPQ